MGRAQVKPREVHGAQTRTHVILFVQSSATSSPPASSRHAMHCPPACCLALAGLLAVGWWRHAVQAHSRSPWTACQLPCCCCHDLPLASWREVTCYPLPQHMQA